MKYIFSFSQVLIIIMLGVFIGCTKDDLQKGKAFAIPSFSNEELSYDAKFTEGDRPNSINLRLTHLSNNGFLNVIEMVNVPKTNDTTYLTHFDEVPNQPIDTFRAFYFVNIDEDAIGDEYVIDTSDSNSESYIILDNYSHRKITGLFQLNFVLDPVGTSAKFDESIPDTFNIRDGSFSAEKY